MDEMIALGVDGIETDHPGLLYKLNNIFNHRGTEAQK